MRKALVTGCAGFIGSYLTERLLSEGLEVIGVDCFSDYYSPEIKEKNIEPSMKNKKFCIIRKNILQLDYFPEVDYVFHEAAQPGIRSSWGKSFETYVASNILATQKLLEYYKDKRLKKFIFASSSSIYGNTLDLPTSENSCAKPFSPYGITKLAAENLCQVYHESFHLPLVCLRYFTVYGPRQRPDMAFSKFLNSIFEKNEITLFGSGNQKRDFTYIDDVVEANILAMETENIEGEIFNIGNGSPISLNDVVAILKYVTGVDFKVSLGEEQKGDVSTTWANVSKAKILLHWVPKTNLSQGLLNQFLYIKNKKTYSA